MSFKHSLTREDYWPFVVFGFLSGTLFLSHVYPLLRGLLGSSWVGTSGQWLALAALNAGAFAYLFSKDVRYRPGRLSGVILYCAGISAALSILKGELLYLIIILPGGIVGFPLMYACGWSGAMIFRTMGYQARIRNRVIQEIQQESAAAARPGAVRKWLMQSFVARRKAPYATELPELAEALSKFARPEEFAEEVARNSSEHQRLLGLARLEQIQGGETLVCLLDQFLLTDKRLVIFKQDIWRGGLTITESLHLKEIVDYQVDLQRGRTVIGVDSGRSICVSALRVPKEVVVRKLIEWVRGGP